MLSFVRRRFTFANVAMTLALVFAMSGGAFAASKYLITSTKQIKPSVLSSLKGKAGRAGANGAQGPAGPAGPAGAIGPQGPAGAGGAAGAAGTKGENGVSVTSAAASKSECAEGGTKFTSASGTSKACNGKEGSPWTAGGTLPSGKTETGVWSLSLKESRGQFLDSGEVMYVPVASFSIPLKEPLGGGQAHFINTNGMEITGITGSHEEEKKLVEATPTECGSAIGPEVNASNPQAKPGNLCVYAGELSNVVIASGSIIDPILGGGAQAGRTGALAVPFLKGTTQIANGTWAVTAE